MTFEAAITIMPKEELLDPQGKAVQHGLHHLHLDMLHDVRVGKHITLRVDADNEADAYERVDQACKNLLANQIMEDYHFRLTGVDD